MNTLMKRSRLKTLLAALVLAAPLGPLAESADARHFGFRGGFRGGYGFKGGFHRGFGGGFHRGFGFNRGFHRGFHRSGFRGFGGFHGSRFNSLAFRHRGFNRFGGFHRVSPGFNSFAFRGSRFGGFPHHRGFVRRGFVSRSPVFVGSAPLIASSPVVVAGDAWTMLERGEPLLASRGFERQIARDTSAGVPKVGFALAAADYGDLKRGVWAMRRAFAADARRVGDMKLDDALRPVVARVTARYEQDANANGMDADRAFMMAALYQLQGDPEMAQMAMEYAVGENEHQPASTTQLVSLIKSEMAALPMEHSRGWDLLADGRPTEARQAFYTEISADPTAGAPKVGFALASAEVGELSRGVWAMRRALSIDAEGVEAMLLPGDLRPVVARIAESYEAAEPNADSRFMLAALYQLQGDSDRALGAIKQAMDEPGEREGARPLLQFVSTDVEMVKKPGGEYAMDEAGAAIAVPPPPTDLEPPTPSTAAAKPADPMVDGEHDYRLEPKPTTVLRPAFQRARVCAF